MTKASDYTVTKASRKPEPIVVTLPNGASYTVKQLLADGDSNVKLAKSNKAGKGYLTFGLSLAAAKSSGYNVCQGASPACIAGCLRYAGHGTMDSVQTARVAKTIAFFEHRLAFETMLRFDLSKARQAATRKGMVAAVRLNVLSDLPWERLTPWVFTEFQDVQFYDYTKVAGRVTPSNYDLTFSRSEINDAVAVAELVAGRNVAVVFATKALPETWQGFRVVNGDVTDLRFLDDRGVVVGLYAKGIGRNDASGFVVRNYIPMVAV